MRRTCILVSVLAATAALGPHSALAALELGPVGGQTLSRAVNGPELDDLDSGSCQGLAISSVDSSSNVVFASPQQRVSIGSRLLETSDSAETQHGAVRVVPDTPPGVTFQARRSTTSLQLLGSSETVGGLLQIDFEHTALCGSTVAVKAGPRGLPIVQIDQANDA